jgi:hypothetical protein
MVQIKASQQRLQNLCLSENAIMITKLKDLLFRWFEIRKRKKKMAEKDPYVYK